MIHPVGSLEDLPLGSSGTIQVGRKLIGIYHTENGFFAIDDVCPHMGASLSSGPVEEGIVTCPWHYWRFRLNDGAWADNPKIKISCYRVVIDGQSVGVEVPDESNSSTDACNAK
jgi:nitrite reductase (NADH) small subunit